MIRRPPRSTLFPTRRSSDLRNGGRECADHHVDDALAGVGARRDRGRKLDRKSTRLNSSHLGISYAVFCLKKKKKKKTPNQNKDEIIIQSKQKDTHWT